MPRSTPGVFNTPITCERYASLSGRMTDDDMFSSDLTEGELGKILGHLDVPCLWVFSGDDEYAPAVKETMAAWREGSQPRRILHRERVLHNHRRGKPRAVQLYTEIRARRGTS